MPGSGRGGPSRRLRRGLRAQRGARVKLRRGRHHDGFGAETHWRKVNGYNARILLSSSPTVGVAWYAGPAHDRLEPTLTYSRNPTSSYCGASARNSVPRRTVVSVQENHAEARLRRRVARRRRGRLAAARHVLRQPAVPPQAERAAAGLPRHAHAGAAGATPKGGEHACHEMGVVVLVAPDAEGARRASRSASRRATASSATPAWRRCARTRSPPSRGWRRRCSWSAALPVPAGALHARGEGRGRLRPRGLLQFSV